MRCKQKMLARVALGFHWATICDVTPIVREERCHQILSFNGIFENHEMCKCVSSVNILSPFLMFFFFFR